MISEIMTDPFTASHPSMLLQAAKALNAVIANCWPRILEGGYDGEATRITATCWLNVGDGIPGVPSPRTGVEELRCELRRTQAMLRSIQEANETPPHAGINEVLEAEPQLKELLSSN